MPKRKAIPKAKILRALVLRRFIRPDQAAEVSRALSSNPEVQRRLGKLWFEERGHRWSRLSYIGQWLWKHRQEIASIIGIIISLSDEGPAEPKHSGPKGDSPNPRKKRREVRPSEEDEKGSDRPDPQQLYSLGGTPRRDAKPVFGPDQL